MRWSVLSTLAVASTAFAATVPPLFCFKEPTTQLLTTVNNLKQTAFAALWSDRPETQPRIGIIGERQNGALRFRTYEWDTEQKNFAEEDESSLAIVNGQRTFLWVAGLHLPYTGIGAVVRVSTPGSPLWRHRVIAETTESGVYSVRKYDVLSEKSSQFPTTPILSNSPIFVTGTFYSPNRAIAIAVRRQTPIVILGKPLGYRPANWAIRVFWSGADGEGEDLLSELGQRIQVRGLVGTRGTDKTSLLSIVFRNAEDSLHYIRAYLLSETALIGVGTRRLYEDKPSAEEEANRKILEFTDLQAGKYAAVRWSKTTESGTSFYVQIYDSEKPGAPVVVREALNIPIQTYRVGTFLAADNLADNFSANSPSVHNGYNITEYGIANPIVRKPTFTLSADAFGGGHLTDSPGSVTKLAGSFLVNVRSQQNQIYSDTLVPCS